MKKYIQMEALRLDIPSSLIVDTALANSVKVTIKRLETALKKRRE